MTQPRISVASAFGSQSLSLAYFSAASLPFLFRLNLVGSSHFFVQAGCSRLPNPFIFFGGPDVSMKA